MKKQLKLDLPEYLTLKSFMEVVKFKDMSPVKQLINTVSVLTGKPYEEVATWPLEVLKDLGQEFNNITDHKETFYPIIEYKGEKYGYASVTQASLGEFVDLENYCKDVHNNLHSIAAILYRPITKDRFNSWTWAIKGGIKAAKGKVENVFNYYEVEDYNIETRKDREVLFEELPVNLVFGAISFFLSTSSLYLTSIQYSEKKISKRTMETTMKNMYTALGHLTGDGSGPFITSVRPVYST